MFPAGSFLGYIYIYICVCKICYTFWVCVYNMLGILITFPSFLFVTVRVYVFCKKCVRHCKVISLGSLCLEGTELLRNLSLLRVECWYACVVRLMQYYSRYPGGYAVQGISIWLLNCWVCGFDSRRGHVMFVGCLGSSLCCKLITHSEESYRVGMCIILCYLGTSVMGWPTRELGSCITE